MDIRPFIRSHILEPFKEHITAIQYTMIEIIADKLQSLYDYTVEFPNIVSPTQDRIDILRIIAEQFSFSIREDADLQEQINILDNILYVYSKRGSIDTIENMWKYYGGSLPRDIEVVVPSNNLFKYSGSNFSGTDKFIKGESKYVVLDKYATEDIEAGALVTEMNSSRVRVTSGVSAGSNRVYLSTVDGLSIGSSLNVGGSYEGNIIDIYESSLEGLNHPGFYEIKLVNNDDKYPISDLKEFLVKELVAAGNRIVFLNTIHSDIRGNDPSSHAYKYSINKDISINIEQYAPNAYYGMRWSSDHILHGREEISSDPPETLIHYDPLTTWSGKQPVSIDVEKYIDLGDIVCEFCGSIDAEISLDWVRTTGTLDEWTSEDGKELFSINSTRYGKGMAERDYWVIKNEMSTGYSLYCTSRISPMPIVRNLYGKDGSLVKPKYFILGETLLGKEAI